jgi:hypothetical protein
MRIETVINSPRDLGCQARLPNLDELQTKGRACNQRILHAQAGRPGLCPCQSSLRADRAPHRRCDRAKDPSPALRRSSGHGPDRRLMSNAARRDRLHQQEPAGLDRRTARQRLPPRTNDLRPTPTAPGRTHPPHPHTNRYQTPEGIRIAVFYTKTYNRMVVPLTAANQPQTPPELRTALATITRHVDAYATHARRPQTA